MDTNTSKSKNLKIRNFLFFLGMAVLLWFLTKFSNEIKANVEADIQYVNVPEEVLLSEKNPKHFSMDLSANGFQMLLYAVKDAVLEIDVGEYYSQGMTQIEITQLELSGIIKRQLGVANVENLSLSPLRIYLDKSIQKKVPIRFNGNIACKEGFRMLSGIQLTPDSVVINGPSEVIAEIDSISTSKFTKKNVEESFVQELELTSPNTSKVLLSTQLATLQIEVEEFTQKEVQVPIQLVNVPKDVKLKLLPENVIVKFEVAVKDFNTVDAARFQVVCDYEDRISEGHFMIPKIVTKPDNIFRVLLETKKVEYLIFK